MHEFVDRLGAFSPRCRAGSSRIGNEMGNSQHDCFGAAVGAPLAGSGRAVSGLDTALEQEFETRLRESSTLAVRVAYSVLRRREDAEDVAQEAFARAYRSFAQLRDRERFRAWLVRMTWRLAINRWRADRRRSAREQVHAESVRLAPTTEETVDGRRRAAALWRAIDALPEKLRIVIVLASIEGHDLAE